MHIGEKINGPGRTYTLIGLEKAGGQAEIGYAVDARDGSGDVFILKRLLSMRYSTKPLRKAASLRFLAERKFIYDNLRKETSEGSNCVVPDSFFHDDAFFYVVARHIQAASFKAADLRHALTPFDLIFFLKTLAACLRPLERLGIVHADLKPDNILFTYHEGRPVCKLIDFESSFHQDSPPPRGEIVSTEPYYSPEVAAHNIEDGRPAPRITPKSDIFTLGVIFLEYLHGGYPLTDGRYVFQLADPSLLAAGIVRHDPRLASCISRMLARNPSSRPTLAEIISELNIANYSIRRLPAAGSGRLPEPRFCIRSRPCAPGRWEIAAFAVPNVKFYYQLNEGRTLVYRHPVTVGENVRFTIWHDAKPVKTEMLTFVKSKGKAGRPVVNLVDGRVVISSPTPGAEIRYTTDLSEPDAKSRIYLRPFVREGFDVVKARAFREGMEPSDVTRKNLNSKTLSS